MKASVWDSVGNTPLIRIKSLSDMTGCEIFGKAEFLNPGGSIKDRAAKGIIRNAEAKGHLKPGSTIVEGTAGNTGIGLATLAAERGYKVLISMPNNQAREKYDILRALGAELILVDPVPFANPAHFYHNAKRLAEERGAFFADQFENLANGEMHFETTGPEIWKDLNGEVDILTLACGTSGTLSGCSRFLKSKKPSLKVVLADPYGSGMCHYFKNGEIKSEGSSITEGIGIMRITANFKQAQIDDAVSINDTEMISMLYHLAKADGLLVGTSAALNLFSAFKLAKKHSGQGKKIVTFLCDHGTRYASRVFNPEFLKEKGLAPAPIGDLV